VYGGPSASIVRRWRIYYGRWGDSPFQPRHEAAPRLLASLTLMPESFIVVAGLAAASAYGLLLDSSHPRLPLAQLPLAFLLLVLAVVAGTALHAGWAAGGSRRVRLLTALLFVLQPVARLWGRISAGLTPWRGRRGRFAVPWPRTRIIWSENWEAPRERLGRLWTMLRAARAAVLPGGSFDRWDMQVRAGPLGSARIRLGVEEHGEGRQLLRFRVWPRWSRGGSAVATVLAVLAALAFVERSPQTAILLALLSAAIIAQMIRHCGVSLAVCLQVLDFEEAEAASSPELVETLEGRVETIRSAIHAVE
jgi:hypothetical protein